MSEDRWRVLLTAPAEKDFTHILKWTEDTFGSKRATVYRAQLLKTFAALQDGPIVPGSYRSDRALAR